MASSFRPFDSTAVDAATGISISQPRMEPIAGEDGRDATEYQYTFRKDMERIGSLGLLGSDALTLVDGHRTWVHTLDLSPAPILQRMLDFQKAIDNQDSAFEFIRALAQGLVNVFVGRTDLRDQRTFLAFTTESALTALGIAVSKDVDRYPDGRLVLAQVVVDNAPSNGAGI